MTLADQVRFPRDGFVAFDGVWASNSRIHQAERHDVDWMVREHYLGRWPGVVVAILALECFGTDRGVVVFALPPRETDTRYGCTTWELARLWVADDVPRNAESWFIAQVVKWVRRERSDVAALVSYADPSAGHAGTIYSAANWQRDGRTDEGRKTPRCDYLDEATGKRYSRRGHVPDITAVIRVPRVSKYRFLLRLRRYGHPSIASHPRLHRESEGESA